MSGGPQLLWLLIGPNGAGKTTYYEHRVRPHLAAEVVNADRIAAAEWPGREVAHGYDAARKAEARRLELLAAGRSFVAETVFSHPSKLDLVREAQQAGYEVWVSFIGLESADLAVARVAERVGAGGHDVPAAKIRERFDRLAPLAVRAVEMADRAFVLDNSDPRRPLRDVLLFERGRCTYVARDLPGWTGRLFAGHLGP